MGSCSIDCKEKIVVFKGQICLLKMLPIKQQKGCRDQQLRRRCGQLLLHWIHQEQPACGGPFFQTKPRQLWWWIVETHFLLLLKIMYDFVRGEVVAGICGWLPISHQMHRSSHHMGVSRLIHHCKTGSSFIFVVDYRYFLLEPLMKANLNRLSIHPLGQ